MKPCECPEPHERRRIVLTGGPGAGKTAVLELARQAFCRHVRVFPEAAGIVYGGGFPRGTSAGGRRANQRAIFHVQHELEAVADADEAAIVLFDRGTLDGGAFWPGPGTLWESVNTTREAELAHYDVVIHLQPPTIDSGYNHQNPLRIESAAEAAAIDVRIAQEWADHPRRYIIESTSNFFVKAEQALTILRDELPACCSRNVSATMQPAVALNP